MLQLLASALGCVAQPFPDGPPAFDGYQQSSLVSENALRRGEAYFNMARKRFGFLERGLLAPQCHFLAGVYLMYTMRPLIAWPKFHAASTSCYVYLRCETEGLGSTPDSGTAIHHRNLEQRIYWSCYKSECEFRIDMDFPNSSLAGIHYPHMLPSPPDLEVPSHTVSNGLYHGEAVGGSSDGNRALSTNANQEESWFYYLTEISLRRIANHVLNTFFTAPFSSWTDETVPIMAKAADEFEQQLDKWYVLYST